MRLIGVLVAAITLSIVSTSPAAAHPNVVDSEPASGAVLSLVPDRVVLRFSEPVELIGAAMALAADGNGATLGKLEHPMSDRTTIVAPVTEMTPGAATLYWRVVGEDSHLVAGSLHFRVERSAGVTNATPSVLAAAGAPVAGRWRTDSAVTGTVGVLRLLAYLALAVLTGGTAFLLSAWPAGFDVAATRVTLWAALAVAAGATVAGVAAQGALLAGRSISGGLNLAVAKNALSTRYGHVALARGALLLAAAVLVALALRDPSRTQSGWWRVSALATALGMLRTPALMGHGDERGLLASGADLVHLAAASIWVGGITMLLVAVLPRRVPGELGAVLKRFSRVATISVTLVVVAGAVLVWPVAATGREALSSGYGRVMALKLAAVGAVFVAAIRSRAWVRAGSTSVAISIGAELGFALLVLSFTAVLVGRTPPS